MNTKFLSLFFLALCYFFVAPTFAHAQNSPLAIDSFYFSTSFNDHITRGSVTAGNSIVLFWNTTGASSCQSSAQIQKGKSWIDAQTPGWTTQNQATNNVSGVQLVPRTATRYYLTCFNTANQISVQKWVEVSLGKNGVSETLQTGTVSGLLGTYYDAAGDPITRDERSQDIVFERTDPRITFAWGAQLPSPLMTSDTFTVEWKGDLIPKKTGMYSFSIVSDDAAALWINDALIVQGSHAQESQENVQAFSSTQNVYLEVGRTYHIRMKTRNARGNAIAQLWWTDPDGAKEIIPSSFLNSDALPQPLPAGKGNGITATYTQHLALSDAYTPSAAKTQNTIGIELPKTFQGHDPFVFGATFQGSIQPRFSTFYRFTSQADGAVDFSLKGEDQTVTILQSTEGYHENHTQSVFLQAGKTYPFTYTYNQSTGNASAQLLWSNAIDDKKEQIPMSQLSSKPVAQQQVQKKGQGLVGSYYNGENLDQYSFRRLDKTINFRWGTGSPRPGIINPDHFSVQWEGMIEAPSTSFYQFSSAVDDRITVWIAGQKILDTSNIRAGKINYSVPILLKQGQRYPIKIHYAQYIDIAYINLMWSDQSGKFQVVPAYYLYPTVSPTTSGAGLRGEYFIGENFETFAARHDGEYLDFTWPAGSSPDPSIPSTHFSARWTGWVIPPATDTYTFSITADDGVRFWISGADEDQIDSGTQASIDQWHLVNKLAVYSANKYLEAGHRYFVKIEFYQENGPSQIHLMWSRKGDHKKIIIPRSQLFPETLQPSQITPPTRKTSVTNGTMGSGTGLRGEYYDDETLSHFVALHFDPAVNFDWGTNTPNQTTPTEHFSVRWTGWIEPRYSEQYTFTIPADDGVRFWISNMDQMDIPSGASPQIDDWHRTPTPSIRQTTQTLEAGHRYFIKLEYFQNVGPAYISLRWSSAHQLDEIIPQTQLYPAQAPAVAPSGNGTGLRGRYYQGQYTATQNVLPLPLLDRTDPAINFAWGYDAPYYSVPSSNFSVRWEGFIQPQYNEEYVFYLDTDNTAKVWMADQPIVGTETPLMTTATAINNEVTSTRILQAGKLYYIRVDYSKAGGDAQVNLSWSSSHTPKSVIPPSQLYPPSTFVISPTH